MPSRTVRPAGPADVVALVELRRLMFEAMGSPGTDRAAWQKGAGAWFREAVELDDVMVAVAEVDGEVVASAMAQLRRGCPSPGAPSGLDALVSSVSTAPGHRRRGHARACVDAVVAWARSAGADRLELFATGDGAAIYESLGFREAAFPAMRAPGGAGR